VPGGVRRPRIGIPVRLSSPAEDPDPRVAKANSLFGCIVSLIRDVGGEPVLLTPESLEGGLNGAPGGRRRTRQWKGRRRNFRRR
jgi:putative glutamine amidotransferase